MTCRENAEQKAYRLIIHDIKTKYQPGDFLLERDLAERFGVSRTPITIALNRLVADGVLQKLPKKGCFIPNLNSEDAHDAFSVRILLESDAARRAASEALPADFSRLEEVLAATEQAIDSDDFMGFTFCDENFHHALVMAAHNSYLYDAWARIYLRCNLYTRFFDRMYTRKTPLKSGTLAEHAAICEALRARDAALGSERVAAHCRDALTYVTGLPQEASA